MQSKPDPYEKQTLEENQLAELEKIAARKIISWAEDGRLAKHEKLAYILYCWERWEGEEKIIEFINKIVSDDIGLVKFISAFLNKGYSQNLQDYVGQVEWRLDHKGLGKFLNTDKNNKYINRIDNILKSRQFKKLNEKEVIALKKFNEFIKSKK